MELQHFNPNGIQQIVAFVTLCEGFLGISPHFDLWWHFLAVSLSKKRVERQELVTPIGCASIQLRNTRATDYPLMRLSTSNKGWHSQWFYVKNDMTTPLAGVHWAPHRTGSGVVEVGRPGQGEEEHQ